MASEEKILCTHIVQFYENINQKKWEKSYFMMHFVVGSIQKWTVYALLKHGIIEKKNETWDTASMTYNIKLKLNKISQNKVNIRQNEAESKLIIHNIIYQKLFTAIYTDWKWALQKGKSFIICRIRLGIHSFDLLWMVRNFRQKSVLLHVENISPLLNPKNFKTISIILQTNKMHLLI